MRPNAYSRRQFLKAAMQTSVFAFPAAGCLSGCQGASSRQDKRSRPNIVFMFSDDCAYQAISAYGSRLAEIAPTPNIDRIAREGMLFNKSYVSNSICAPARAVILTGKHSHLNGVIDNRVSFDGSQQTFPKLLQQAGYQTALIGKWHLKSEPTGFDHWQILPGQGHYYNPDFVTPRGTVTENGYVTDLITDKGLHWLDNGRDKSKPFLLMLQHKAPHREWEPETKYLDLFDDVTIPEPENLFDDYATRGTAAHQQDMTIAETMYLDADNKVWGENAPTRKAWQRAYGRMNAAQRAAWDAAYVPENEEFRKAKLTGKDLVRWKYQRYMKDYLRCVRSVDDSVGRVLNYLDEHDLTTNTVVVFSSDQGFYLGEHGWFDKRFMYEESFRTPLIVRWSGVTKPGSINDDLVQNLDYAQTFLDIAQVAAPSDMQGLSLKPLLAGRTPGNWRKSLYYHFYEYPAVHSVRRHEGVADKNYKLMFFYDLDEWEFYDLAKDPHEMNNVYDAPAYKESIAELKEELMRLRTYYRVPPNQPSEKLR